MIVSLTKQVGRCKMTRKMNKILNLMTICMTEEWTFLASRSKKPKKKDKWRNKKHYRNIRKQTSSMTTFKLRLTSSWQ